LDCSEISIHTVATALSKTIHLGFSVMKFHVNCSEIGNTFKQYYQEQTLGLRIKDPGSGMGWLEHSVPYHGGGRMK
jgi:hypothetical protein